jgi:tetratricopeptide (TPR) repeat protein
MLRRFIILSVLLSNLCFSQQSARDSLLQRLAGANEQEQISIYVSLVNAGLYASSLETIEYGERGLALARKYADNHNAAQLLSTLALLYCARADLNKALMYAEESLALSTHDTEQNSLSASYSALGVVYSYLGRYSKALEYHLEALAIRKQLGEPLYIAKSLNNIGTIYHRLEQYQKALTYYQQALKIHIQVDNTVGHILTLHNIGDVFQRLGNYDSALAFHSCGFDLAKRYNNELLPFSNYNMGLVMMARRNFSMAKDYFRTSYTLYSSNGKNKEAAEALNGLAEAYERSDDRQQALAISQRAVTLAKSINTPGPLKVSYERLYRLFANRSNMLEAYRYFKLYIAARDSLVNQKENYRIADLSIQYEGDKKKREIDMVRKIATIRDLEAKSRNNLLVGGVVFIGLLTAFVSIRIMLIQRTRSMLRQKKEELETLNTLLQEKIANIRILGGLLPMCPRCKSIKNDKGYWEQLESYISDHTDASFSHGICPTCAKKLYPDYFEKKEKGL